MNEKTKLGENGIYDAKTLGTPKVILLGLQHMFAMFGATILVPMLTGLDVSTTLLFAGLGTLLFHLITKGKVPAFLGSSFAFLGGYAAIAPMTNAAGEAVDNAALLPYACFGVACSGLLYLVLALLIKIFGTSKTDQTSTKDGSYFVFTPYIEKVEKGKEGPHDDPGTIKHVNIFGAFPKEEKAPETPSGDKSTSEA